MGTTAASRTKGRGPARKEKAAREPNGLQKAAILILSLDEETASRVLRALPEPEAELITREIARLWIIEKEVVAQVLAEFSELVRFQELIRAGGPDRAQELIRKTFPPATAQRLTRLLDAQKRSAPFAFLKNAELDSLHAFLEEEHPQTAALVLSYLEPSKAAELLRKMPSERQFDVVRRIAHLEHSSPETIKHVESGLQKRLSSLAFERPEEVGGVKTVAGILNVLDRATERAILDDLEADSPEAVEEIKKLMFVFEDIVKVDDRGVQNLFKEVDTKRLALALKTASPELKEKLFRNLSQRAAEMVKEEIEFLGPVRVADVERAQEEIVEIVRRLEEAGEVIILGRGAEGELVV